MNRSDFGAFLRFAVRFAFQALLGQKEKHRVFAVGCCLHAMLIRFFIQLQPFERLCCVLFCLMIFVTRIRLFFQFFGSKPC
ncbi:hypothetical protein LI291_15635, partial [Intestinibacillus massiliensis]|nr:hypothetical protein [Intestinibacillus massiliensis]